MRLPVLSVPEIILKHCTLYHKYRYTMHIIVKIPKDNAYLLRQFIGTQETATRKFFFVNKAV